MLTVVSRLTCRSTVKFQESMLSVNQLNGRDFNNWPPGVGSMPLEGSDGGVLGGGPCSMGNTSA